MFTPMKEIWKDVKGYVNYYEISNLARVKLLPKHNVKHPLIMSPHLSTGTPRVVLVKNNKLVGVNVKTLVYNAFYDDDVYSRNIYSINGDSTNVELSNLARRVKLTTVKFRKSAEPFKLITDKDKKAIMKYFWSHDDNMDCTIAKKFGYPLTLITRFTNAEVESHFDRINNR